MPIGVIQHEHIGGPIGIMQPIGLTGAIVIPHLAVEHTFITSLM